MTCWWRQARAIAAQPATSRTIAVAPTTTISARSAAGESRRPYLAPSWPPTIEPAAISTAGAQATCATSAK